MRVNMFKRYRRCIAYILVLISVSYLPACGFIQRDGLSEAYVDNVVEDIDDATCVVTWPVHLLVLTFTAILDQTLHTFLIFPPTFRDSMDYFLLEGNGNNILLERAVFIPKAVATPLIFVLSYVTRWFVPIEDDTRPFHFEDVEREQETPKRPEAIEDPVPPEESNESAQPANSVESESTTE